MGTSTPRVAGAYPACLCAALALASVATATHAQVEPLVATGEPAAEHCIQSQLIAIPDPQERFEAFFDCGDELFEVRFNSFDGCGVLEFAFDARGCVVAVSPGAAGWEASQHIQGLQDCLTAALGRAYWPCLASGSLRYEESCRIR